jgi:DNA-binding NtrC family response regulator
LPDILEQPAAADQPPAAARTSSVEHGELTLAEIERQAILRTLELTHGNKRAAASILGVYRPTLYGKLRKYKLGEYSDSAKTQKKRRQTEDSPGGESTDAEPDAPTRQSATRP